MRYFLITLLFFPMIVFADLEPLSATSSESLEYFDAISTTHLNNPTSSNPLSAVDLKDQTPFDTIVEWYDEAESITFEEAKKKFGVALEGRCFSVRFKNNGLLAAIILASQEMSEGGNLGPGFPPKKWTENKVALLASTNPPSFSKSNALSYTQANWRHFEEVLSADSHLKFKQIEIKGEARIYNSWLVILTQNREDLIKFDGAKCKDIYGDQCVDGVLPKGSITNACYYYQELK